MMKLRLLLFGIAAAVAALGPVGAVHAQTASPSPAPIINSPPPLPSPKPAPEDPKIRKLAIQQFLAWQQGTVDRADYSDDINAQLSDDTLNGAERSLAAMGGLQQTVFRGISRAKNVDVYVYHMVCERASVDMDFAMQPDGKIAIIFFE